MERTCFVAGIISMGARREVLSAVAERYWSAGRVEKGCILDALCRTTGWHRKHAVRALRQRVVTAETRVPRERKRRYGATIKDALTALWEASDRVCGKRLVAMIPTLLPALEQHGRLQLSEGERGQLLAMSAATIDRLLGDVKVAAAGGRRRRVGFYSAIRREVPIRTFNDWNDPPPGFCEVDMVAHGGTSVAGSFIQTLTMVDVATGWTECLPLVSREGSLVVEAIKRAQSLFPWIILGADFDNDSAFMNDIVVPWCRAQKIEVTRSRAQYRTLDPVVLLSEIRAAQEELGRRIDRRGLVAASQVQLPISNTADFAQTLGKSIKAGEPRGTHRRAKRKYKTRVRMPSKLDPHLAIIEGWLATEPQLTALAIVGRLAQRDADQFGPKQHSIVQRLLKALRNKAAERLIAATTNSRTPTLARLRSGCALPPSCQGRQIAMRHAIHQRTPNDGSGNIPQ